MEHARYRIAPTFTPLPSHGNRPGARNGDAGHADAASARSPFARAENEDDDGYDPYSDRPADPDRADVEDPWR